MLGLPRSTDVNRRIPKEKLYTNAKMNTMVKDKIKDQIELIVWRNKLADCTMSVSSGETIKEIHVFEIVLRQKALDKRILPTIAKVIPYKILFILTFNGEAQAWMEVANTFYNTDWFTLEGLIIKYEGLSLEAVYESLARQIAGGRLDAEGDISEAVARDKQKQKLEREIEALEKRVMREKQFNRKIGLNSELKRLQAELEVLNR